MMNHGGPCTVGVRLCLIPESWEWEMGCLESATQCKDPHSIGRMSIGERYAWETDGCREWEEAFPRALCHARKEV